MKTGQHYSSALYPQGPGFHPQGSQLNICHHTTETVSPLRTPKQGQSFSKRKPWALESDAVERLNTQQEEGICKYLRNRVLAS